MTSRPALACLVLACSLADSTAADEPFTATLRVPGAVSHPLEPRVFGQFLEVPNWGGENGPDAAWDAAAGSLRADVVERLARLRTTFVRFPGGTAIDHADWTRFIDNAPGRAEGAGRPVLNPGEPGELRHHVGYHEFLDLAERLGWEPLLPVNLLDAIAKRKSVADTARHAAALVAYVNAPVGAPLPDGLAAWPALRAANGRERPWRVRFWQIGNEWFVPGFANAAREAVGSSDPATLAAWYRTCVTAVIDALHAVDPTIEIVVDAAMHDDIEEAVLADPAIRGRASYATLHRYAPWAVRRLTRAGVEIAPATATTEELWRSFAALPGTPGPDGQMTWDAGRHGERATRLGYRLVCTEWNWNGWWALPRDQARPEFEFGSVMGIGAAGFLHGLLRDPRVAFANQSMTVGRSWGITAIRVDRDEAPRYLPQAAALLLYAEHHGSDVLVSTLADAPRWVRPLGHNNQEPPEAEVSALDVVVTASPTHVFLHVINREHDRPARLRYEGPPVEVRDAFRAAWDGPPATEPPEADVEFVREPLAADDLASGLRVPPRSVSVFVLPRRS